MFYGVSLQLVLLQICILPNCFQSLFEIFKLHSELGTFITSELHNQLVNFTPNFVVNFKAIVNRLLVSPSTFPFPVKIFIYSY